MVKAIIIDDEKNLRELIRNMLSDFFPRIRVVGEADSVESGAEAIESYKPDLIFLDIEIRGGTGFNILQNINYKNFKIIFVTAFNEFAIQAIKYSAIDYILKPINQKEFESAVQRALGEIEKPIFQNQIENFFNNYQNLQNKKLVLRTSESMHIVNIDDIIRCEADNSYTTFYTTDNEKILVSKGIKEFEDLLKNFVFIRPHQSHLVNLNFVKRLDKSDGSFLVMKDGKEIPVSTRRKQNLLHILSQL